MDIPKVCWLIVPTFGSHKMFIGQIIAISHDMGPQKVAEEGKSPYFRDI